MEPPRPHRSDPTAVAAKPAVIAHRGASGHVRENTVEAFELAVELGADGIELDVRRTADDHLVVHHDPAIDGYGLIHELRLGQLPEHVATLSDALSACRGAWVNVEIKNISIEPGHDPTDALVRSVLSVLDRSAPSLRGHGANGDAVFVISSFDRLTLRQVRELAPEMTTALLVAEVNDDIIASCHRNGHRYVHPWLDRLDHDDVVLVAEGGLGCNVWTCNDVESMARLIDWGVDGIITDYPDIARSLLDSASSADP